MSALTPEPGPESSWQTLRRGLELSPELRRGLGVTLTLALVSTGGRVVIPITIQQVIDRGVAGAGRPDLATVLALVAVAAVAVAVTAVAGTAMNRRLAEATEHALSNLRVRAFRHIHDLSVLHQATEQRGALVGRVTADVDTISQFMQWGGIVLLVSLAQLLLATVAMAFYSIPLTLVVLAVFLPLLPILAWFQRRLSRAYDLVRERVGTLLSAISESISGAAVVRAYGLEDRTNARMRAAVRRHYDAGYRAARLAAVMFATGEIFAALAVAAVVVVGVGTTLADGLTAGRLIGFLFLVALFVSPVQVATEVLNEAQTAIAGWRRVLRILDVVPDVADPAAGPDGGLPIPPGPIALTLDGVSFAYPGGPPALHTVDLEIPAQRRIAVVGETGSGKSTFAKLLTRLMDPGAGRILVNGVPLDRVRFAELRRRVVLVPQDGHLFRGSIRDNVRHGRDDLDDAGILLAFTELGLADWVESLPAALDTPVGDRGEELSVGERQLVALARAYVANPDLLVLDEATSAVDPRTEVRLQRALEGLTRGRTAITIAHRLSTAETADEILVFDSGRLVQRGPHHRLLTEPGPYRGLHDSWRARPGSAA